MNDTLHLLLAAGDVDVAWDLCEQEGWCLPEEPTWAPVGSQTYSTFWDDYHRIRRPAQWREERSTDSLTGQYPCSFSGEQWRTVVRLEPFGWEDYSDYPGDDLGYDHGD